MTTITVLGAGMVGSAIAKDLAQDDGVAVVVADRSAEALARLEVVPHVRTVQADLAQGERVAELVADCDLVVNAVPGAMGYATMRAIIGAGKDVVDIAFFPEDAFGLDALAKANGVTAVVDCGVAPGLCNVIAGHVYDRLDRAERYACYVGGLPRVRRWPYEYGAVFSPADVIEEYTRPARFVEHGAEVVYPALSGVERIDLPGVDTLEAFNSDGLRSLRDTLDIPHMVEKTLRYPGHADLMRVFRDSGFFDAAEIEVDGQAVSPLAVTSKLLFDQWQLGEADHDFTVMRVVVEGRKDGEHVRYTYDLLDYFDEATGVTSMARTTGYTCAIVARQVLRGLFSQKGICPPEYLGRTPGCWDDLLAGYAARGIRVAETIETRS